MNYAVEKEANPIEFIGGIARNAASEINKILRDSLDLLYVVYYCLVKVDKGIFTQLMGFSLTLNLLTSCFSFVFVLLQIVFDCFCKHQLYNTDSISRQTRVIKRRSA